MSFFEKLDYTEKNVLIPLLKNELKGRIGGKKFISNEDLVSLLNDEGYEEVYDGTIRKLIFHIRNFEDGFDFLIANSEGYFISNNIEEVTNWINIHREKIQVMRITLDSIEKQLRTNVDKLKKGEKANLGGQLSIWDVLQ